MAKFMCTCILSPGELTPERIRHFAHAAQTDPMVRGYRSFASLAEGKAICIMEAPNKEALTFWFAKVNMPVDSIIRMELEGDRGNLYPLN